MRSHLHTSLPAAVHARLAAALPTLLTLALVPAALEAPQARAQQAGYGQTFGTSPLERQLYDGGNGNPRGGSILDTTNPMDLMNKIRRGTAMDDATPPASAIDQALKELETKTTPAAAASTPAPAGAPAPSGIAREAAAPTAPVWTVQGIPATGQGAVSQPSGRPSP